MEALLVVVMVIFLVAVLANISNKSDRLEAENEAFRIVFTSMQRDAGGNDHSDGFARALALLILFAFCLIILAL